MPHADRTKAWTINKLKAATARDLQMAIRLESADQFGRCQCCTCGKIANYKDMHSGHFLGGRTNSIVFREDNLHPQCPRCNHYLSGNLKAYQEYMLNKYGPEKVDELKRLQGKTLKFSREELIEMRIGYRERIKAEMKRLGA